MKGKWTCHICARKPKKFSHTKSSKKLSSTQEEKQNESSANNSSSCVTSKETSSKESGKRKENGPSKSEKECKKDRKWKDSRADMTFCRNILNDMEKHDDAWPFLLPVNTKQFPTYKKIIKKPMDTNTIRNKLDSSRY